MSMPKTHWLKSRIRSTRRGHNLPSSYWLIRIGLQKSEPAELSKTNRIHKAQKRFTALKRLRQISRCQLLQPMQTIGQTQREQGLSLTHHLARTQTGTPGRNLQGVDAEMGGEILLTGLRQGIRSGLLVPVGHQRALITAGGVIATRFQGVIDHQHQPMAEATGHLIDATKGVAMPFRRPPGRGTQRGQAETAGFGHAQCLSPQIVRQRHRHARQRRGAIRRMLQGSCWQRFRVHFVRNLLQRVPKAHQGMATAALRPVFAQEKPSEIEARWDHLASSLAERFPNAAKLMLEASEDMLTSRHFPEQHWRKVWSTKLLKRVDDEIKRRTRVMGIFPNNAAITRRVAPVLLEQDEHWQLEGRRMFSAESMAAIPALEELPVQPSLQRMQPPESKANTTGPRRAAQQRRSPSGGRQELEQQIQA